VRPVQAPHRALCRCSADLDRWPHGVRIRMDTSTGPARDPPLGLMPLPNGSDQRDTGAIKDFYVDVEVGGDLGEHDTCPRRLNPQVPSDRQCTQVKARAAAATTSSCGTSRRC
jgi:hypothetical protein